MVQQPIQQRGDRGGVGASAVAEPESSAPAEWALSIGRVRDLLQLLTNLSQHVRMDRAVRQPPREIVGEVDDFRGQIA
jgi:hypothetical protein